MIFVRSFIINPLLAILAMIRYGFPQKGLTLVAITGTDGKTTTAHFLNNILKSDSRRVGLISTLGAEIDGQQIDTGLHTSTPGPIQIYGLLSDMKKAGAEIVILETTSHGLDQRRVWGLSFAVGVITNISPEHLDYHKTFERYSQAKARLIGLSRCTFVSKDNPTSKSLAEQSDGLKTFSVTDSEADIYSTEMEVEDNCSKAVFMGSERFPIDPISVTIPLPGSYNIANALAASGVAMYMGVSTDAVCQGLVATQGIAGRWAEIQAQPFRVIIDFAHTPQSFEQLLPQAQGLARKQGGRLIHVFGSAANRDTSKRQTMGELSGQWADVCVITAEDPRNEPLDAIQVMISRGIVKAGKQDGIDFWRIDDRREAIGRAIALAQPGDVVLITGKGHEKSLALGDKEIPWSDAQVAREALEQLEP